ncbi:cyclase family protein [Baekduia sp. Peel2402]|uniref:cyclase family protein n=1 Tax=Baekduia sp. Peel2402 TaxID=3458296 RepID=UPI00403EED05
MTQLIDISMPLRPGMVAWPGSPGIEASYFQDMAAGDVSTATRLSLDVHCGTHVDAPMHQVAGAAPMAAMRLEDLCGPAEVVEVGDAKRIDAADLQDVVPEGTTRVLLKTSNSRGGVVADGFDEDYAALTAEGAQWLVDHGVVLVGIDYLSIQRFDEDNATHVILLSAPIIILEGLTLTHVEPGSYELFCLPISVPELEAAPARAVLRSLENP